jgi:hypothetical protein
MSDINASEGMRCNKQKCHKTLQGKMWYELCLCECNELWVFVFFVVGLVFQVGLKVHKRIDENAICKRA